MRWWLALMIVGCSPKSEDEGTSEEGPTSAADNGASGDADADTDSDGDGFTDADEVNQNTDPDDASDHPYAGGWPIDSCRHDIVGTGNMEGDIAENWALTDQFGEEISLHDFCDHAVLLVGSAFW
jgi:hypothetical protein